MTGQQVQQEELLGVERYELQPVTLEDAYKFTFCRGKLYLLRSLCENQKAITPADMLKPWKVCYPAK